MGVHSVGISPHLLKSRSHSHKLWEIVLNIEGEGTTIIDGKEYSFYPGSIICLPPNVLHSKLSENKFKDIYILVSNFSIPANDSISTFCDDEDKSFEALMFLALRTYHKKMSGYANVLSSLYNTMYQLLISWCDSKQKNIEVELFKNYMIENFSNPEFQISDAMRKISYCTDHFRRLFKKETGVTPISYLTNLRINFAKKLLSQKSDSNMTISEISLLSGFYDSHYFSRLFKSTVGLSPSDYIMKND